MAKERSTAEGGNDGANAGEKAQPALGGGALSLVFLPFVAIGTVIGKVWNGITSDGVLASAGRQGIDELGSALKAFPDSIQREETGTLWSPTQAEITASRQHGRQHGGNWSMSSSSLTPPAGWSQVADQHDPGNDRGHDNGHDAGHSM